MRHEFFTTLSSTTIGLYIPSIKTNKERKLHLCCNRERSSTCAISSKYPFFITCYGELYSCPSLSPCYTVRIIPTSLSLRLGLPFRLEKLESALGLHAHLAYVVHVQLAQMLNEGGGSRPYILPAIFLKMPYSPPIPVPAFVPESEAALPLIMMKG